MILVMNQVEKEVTYHETRNPPSVSCAPVSFPIPRSLLSCIPNSFVVLHLRLFLVHQLLFVAFQQVFVVSPNEQRHEQ
jgi:hypothetical protein